MFINVHHLLSGISVGSLDLPGLSLVRHLLLVSGLVEFGREFLPLEANIAIYNIA